jgi:dienelactone hydrolase
MKFSSAALALLLAACASSSGVTSLSDGRTGSFPILTTTWPTVSGADAQAGTVTADLTVPPGTGRRVPAVILLHACAGVLPPILEWQRELNAMGYAALVVDSFTGRGVNEVCTGRTSVSIGSRLADLFRAHELLGTHPAIDPERIAVLGFSHGGWAALWASQRQFQRRFMRGVRPDLAAFLAFYPVGCNVRLRNEADMEGGPVRIFQGTADDWTTIDQCRDWVERRRAAGRDVTLTEYEGAMHGFDIAAYATPQRFDSYVNPSGCVIVMQLDGTYQDEAGKPFSGASPCMKRGASMGHDARAHQQSIEDVKAFLAAAFARR